MVQIRLWGKTSTRDFCGFVAGADKALHELIDKLAQLFERLEW
jgi:hypothetical protein